MSTIHEMIEAVVAQALSYKGEKYSQPKRLQTGYKDCSSLVARAYITAIDYEWGCRGRPVPRSLEEVYEDGFELIWPAEYGQVGKTFGSKIKRVSLNLQRGDILFAATKGMNSNRANKIEHVVMLTSPDKIIHARGTAYGVREDNVSLYDGKICAVVRFNPSCNLVRGHIGNRVRALQKALNAAMKLQLSVDGEFGHKTQSAVLAYQNAWSLPATGVADKTTRASLGIMETEWDAPVPTRRKLMLGDKGDSVRELQQLLLDAGEKLEKFGVDGDFGSETFAALKSYQYKQGIAEDGVCGPVTWAHLLGEIDDGSIPTVDNWVVKVTAGKSAYVRTLPGVNYGEVRGVVESGAILKATGSFTDVASVRWYNVVYDGELVWISSNMGVLLQDDTPIDELPIHEPEKPDQPSKPSPHPIPKARKVADISKWQGTLNFTKMADEAAFLINRGLCRITQDAKYEQYKAGMDANGIPNGMYYFTYAKNKKEIIEGADLQWQIGQRCQIKPLYYVLDAEVSTLTKDIIVAWVSRMRGLGAKWLGLYVGHHFYAKFKIKEIKHLFDFIWIPRYGKNSGKQEIRPAYECDLWQFTSMGAIAGSKGRVDLNVVMHDLTGKGKTMAWFRGEEEGGPVYGA